MIALRWAAALAATLALLSLDLIGASRSGSQALWADVIHVSLDALAIALAAVTFLRPGAHTTRLVLGVQAGLMLLLGGLYALRVLGILPAHAHFRDPDIAFRVAFLGLVANLGAAWMLRGAENLRGALYHALGDAAGSVFATGALFLVKLTGDASWDSIGAFAVCVTMWIIGIGMMARVVQTPALADEGSEVSRPAFGSITMALFLVACTILVAGTAAGQQPTVWRFLHPTLEAAHGDVDGSGGWDIPLETPRGSLSAAVHLTLLGQPSILDGAPRFHVEIFSGGERVAEDIWVPDEPAWILRTPRWIEPPVEVIGEWLEVHGELPDLPPRDLRLHVTPESHSILPEADSEWAIEWRLMVETMEPFKVEPLKPMACPPRRAVFFLPC